MPLRPAALIAALAVVVGVLENTLFGSDTAGTTKHTVAVLFFFLAVVGIVALVVIGIVAIARKVRRTA